MFDTKVLSFALNVLYKILKQIIKDWELVNLITINCFTMKNIEVLLQFFAIKVTRDLSPEVSR